MIMWVMSDRAIPRSFRMMEGFGIHTFRLVNAQGKSRLVKFHWKPLLGVHSVAWDEAQKISGKDPDFHRRDLWEAIEAGSFPQWELGLQIVEEQQEHDFDFDLLDATKLIPEELVPVQRVGRLTLDRNPDNFFAETEQVAFHPGHIVPGIDFTNDPLLQGRLFSYTDTQLTRLGGPNFHEIPINRSISPVVNNQRDGLMRQTISTGPVAYGPNTIAGGCPMQVKAAAGGFVSFAERLDAPKVRARSEKFFDHFSQATLFWNSQSPPERDHLVEALCFELGKVGRPHIRERIVGMLALVDPTLAARVAEGLGLPEAPRIEAPLNRSIPADGNPKDFQPKRAKSAVEKSEALSMANTAKDSIATRKVAILVADGVDDASLARIMKALAADGAQGKLIAPRLGQLKGDGGETYTVDFSLLTAASVLFDAVFVPGGKKSVQALTAERDAVEFVTEAFRHCKTIGAVREGVELLLACPGLPVDGDAGVVAGANGQVVKRFVEAMAEHRHWTRKGRNRLVASPDGDETRGRNAGA